MSAIAAHRGGAALWPENSAVAFRGAMGLAVEQIEFDVQQTRDGVPVIFHDTSLDRVTDGSGILADKTLAELKALAIKGGGGAILTLAEGLDILAPSHLTLRCEIKPGPRFKPYAGLPEKLLGALAERALTARTVVTSFHLPTLRRVRELAPELPLIWLVAEPVLGLTSIGHVIGLAQAEGIEELALHHASLEPANLAELRAGAMRFGAYAVLEDEAIAAVLAIGVSVFTTDRPDAALRLRERLATAAAG